MTLDELIAQMTNPQDFTRLCNSVFIDIYHDNFQVIDGTRSDNGNDEYIASERRMLAMHCPIKPEQKTDAGYLKKIRGDLEKAAALKRDMKYEIETWTFITPRKLADDVISEMRAIGQKNSIRATHLESTFLANELYKRNHLLKGFPSLQQIDLSEQIAKIWDVIGPKNETSPVQPINESENKLAIRDDAGSEQLGELSAEVPTQDAKSKIKALAYRTSDPVVEINAILTLFRWFVPVEDDRGELVGFADRGIDLAKKCNLTDAEALLHAHKAAMLLWSFNTSLIEAHSFAVAGLSWLQTSPMEQPQEGLTRLRKLDEAWRSEAAAAMELSRKSRDLEAIGGVLVVLGTNIGQLAQVHRDIKETDSADQLLGYCKNLLMAAKDSYAAAGDELGATNAVFNLANQIRFHGAKDEAIGIVRATIPIAERHRDQLLQQKAIWLLHTLETGEMPDYAAGDRRDWSLKPTTAGKKG